jgi:hypothetical protein
MCRPRPLDSIRELARAALALLLLAVPAVAFQREKPPVPDLTAGGKPDGKHDWNLGPTGARGWMWGWNLETTDARQVLVTAVAPGSPAAGVLEVGDVILGVGGEPFTRDPRRVLGDAITAAEGREGKGRLELLLWRESKRESVSMRLPVLGDYADGAPWDCPKSERILQQACEHIAAHMKGDIDGMMNALALLATGERKYRKAVEQLAHEVGDPSVELTLEGRTSGLYSWEWGYRNLFLCEYQLATGDRRVMPAIVEYSTTIAQGQSGVGTWGHGMAWPDLNGGRLHGRLGGYGALNQAGLVCHLSLVLARKCGVRDPEIDAAIERANRFAAFYAGKGAIPYGDHRPGWDVHDDNGKNSIAALIFDLQGMRTEARFFARMTVASYGERERGHTGNYFSYLWGPLGAARVGPDAVAAFLREQRWYYDLARSFDGSFPYQGGAGMDGGEHQYGDWDCTAAFVLASMLPRGKLYLTGKGFDPANALVGDELEDTIAAGRGFDSWSLASEHYEAMESIALLSLLESWSPAVRTRAGAALAKQEGEPVPALLELLRSEDLDARYGACQALGALGPKAAEAVPALTRTLEEDDVWLRIQAAYALAGIGDAARPAAPALLELALRDDPADPRQFTQRYLAFCLFYPGGALKMRGLLARSLEGIDRELLLSAVERLLANDDGRARGAVGTVYENLTLEEIAPILPAVVEAVRTPSPSGVMFANDIRLRGLDLLARHRIREGMQLCIPIMEIDQWGKQDRILRGLRALATYGGAAKPLLDDLRGLLRRLEAHPEARNLGEQIALCRETLAAIEAAPEGEPLRSVGELAR